MTTDVVSVNSKVASPRCLTAMTSEEGEKRWSIKATTSTDPQSADVGSAREPVPVTTPLPEQPDCSLIIQLLVVPSDDSHKYATGEQSLHS
jgi:hypothetical protein